MVDGMPPNGPALLSGAGPGGCGQGHARGRSSRAGPDASLACGHVDRDAAPSPGRTDVRLPMTSVTPGPSASLGDSARPPPRALRALRAASGQGDLSWGLRSALVPWVVARAIVAGALVAAHEIREPGQARRRGGHACPRRALGVGRGVVRVHRPPRVRRGRAICRCGSSRSCRCSRAPCRTSRASGSGPRWWWWPTCRPSWAWRCWPCWRRRETGDDALARRAAWLVCLAPAAFTQVMGYAEGTLLALSVGTFLALRARAWWWAAVLGLAAGATRPLGVLLVVPAAIEAMRGWRELPAWSPPGSSRCRGGPRRRACGASSAGSGGATATPWPRSGSSNEGTLRGGFADPLRTLAHDAVAPGPRPTSRVGAASALGPAGRRPGRRGAAPVAAVLRRLRRGRSWSWRSRRRTSTGSSATRCRPSRWCWPGRGLTSGPRRGAGGPHPGRGGPGRLRPAGLHQPLCAVTWSCG